MSMTPYNLIPIQQKKKKKKSKSRSCHSSQPLPQGLPISFQPSPYSSLSGTNVCTAPQPTPLSSPCSLSSSHTNLNVFLLNIPDIFLPQGLFIWVSFYHLATWPSSLVYLRVLLRCHFLSKSFSDFALQNCKPLSLVSIPLLALLFFHRTYHYLTYYTFYLFLYTLSFPLESKFQKSKECI